jgi:hypothetical protein
VKARCGHLYVIMMLAIANTAFSQIIDYDWYVGSYTGEGYTDLQWGSSTESQVYAQASSGEPTSWGTHDGSETYTALVSGNYFFYYELDASGYANVLLGPPASTAWAQAGGSCGVSCPYWSNANGASAGISRTGDSGYYPAEPDEPETVTDCGTDYFDAYASLMASHTAFAAGGTDQGSGCVAWGTGYASGHVSLESP